MTIHHATKKRAAKVGVIMTETDTGTFAAKHAQTGITFYGDDAKLILSYTEAAVLQVEEGDFYVTQLEEGGDYVAFNNPRSKGAEPVARDPDLDDLYETLTDMENEPEEEEEGTGGSVVPNKYKKIYAERGDATNCGDWLALTLNKYCHVLNEKNKPATDIDRFIAIAIANGIDADYLDKLNSGTPGWQGRLRMSARNLLTTIVADAGFLIVPAGHGTKKDLKEKAPQDWIDAKLKARREKEDAKKAKADAKATKKAEKAKEAA